LQKPNPTITIGGFSKNDLEIFICGLIFKVTGFCGHKSNPINLNQQQLM
jgi:hypothetical protein